MRLGHYVQVVDMAETDRLWNTLCRWWPAIEVLLITGVINAKTEAGNTGSRDHRTHRPRLPQRTPLRRPYPPHQCRPRRSRNTHHREPTFTRNREEPVNAVFGGTDGGVGDERVTKYVVSRPYCVDGLAAHESGLRPYIRN